MAEIDTDGMAGTQGAISRDGENDGYAVFYLKISAGLHKALAIFVPRSKEEEGQKRTFCKLRVYGNI